MKASIIILTSKVTKKGHPICVELFISSKKRFRKTIGYTESHFWDAENAQLLKSHPEYYLLSPTILEYKAKCIQIDYSNYTSEDALNFLFEPETINKEALFLEFFKTRIQEKKVKNQAFQSYADVQNIILEYLQPKTDITINEVTYEWLNKFVLYKIEHGCKMGGVMSYLRTMRAVYKEAQRRTSLRIKQDNPFIGIMKVTAAKPVIELHPDQLKINTHFVPNKNTHPKNALKQQRNLQLLLFQFYIGGHDLIDVALLKWTNIKNNRIVFKRHKNRNKNNGGPLVDNKLFDAALKIIDTYGNSKTQRIFDFIPDPIEDEKRYITFRSNYNRSLKSISKIKVLPEYLKSKSTRYLFRTYAGELLINSLIIMKLQGHMPEGITYNYQGNISYQVIDNAHTQIIDYLLNKNAVN